ncbi:MAG: hypothetical protein WBR11_18560 [Terriglobales bacterium]
MEIAQSTDEAFRRLDAGIYHMVISDLRMETEEAGLEVIRAAHRQSYAPATALLTAFPPSEELTNGLRSAGQPDSLLVKPIGTRDLVRQIEAMLIRHADQRETHRRLRDAPTPVPKRSAG